MKYNPFQSDIIEEIRKNGGEYQMRDGRMVCLPVTFGFCSGVMRAVSLLAKCVYENPMRRKWLLGAMIHNPAVNDWFVEQGVKIVPREELDSVFAMASPTDLFVIPAFGLPVELDMRLRDFTAGCGTIIDTTCPFVRKVWDCAKCAGEGGQAIIIHGKKGHQETEAIWSRAVKYAVACALITSPEEAELFAQNRSLLPEDQLFNEEKLEDAEWRIVNQTTMLASETALISDILKKATWHAKSLELASTICTATRERQQSAIELCLVGCDCIIVLGGLDSSNTTQLYRLAVSNIGPRNCYFVESFADIGMDSIKHYIPEQHRWQTSDVEYLRKARKIGILAGASCPDCELEKLLVQLANLN